MEKPYAEKHEERKKGQDFLVAKRGRVDAHFDFLSGVSQRLSFHNRYCR